MIPLRRGVGEKSGESRGGGNDANDLKKGENEACGKIKKGTATPPKTKAPPTDLRRGIKGKKKLGEEIRARG